MPQAWTDDRERCRAAKIPDEVPFRTKPELAQLMLETAWCEGIPLQWVTGDSLYGNSPGLRHSIHDHERYYVMEIGSHHRVTLASGASVKLSELPTLLSRADWEPIAHRLGEKGVLMDDWQTQRVVLAADADVIGEQWLLIRRSGQTQPCYRFYRSNAPLDTHCIEDLLGEAKGEVGMADHEVRHWHGWYRHMTLVMVAHTWFKLVQHGDRQKNAVAIGLPLQLGGTATDG